jgi:acyl-CoA hydrolase
MCQVLTSADCNKLNTVALGPILRWMDIAACLSAEKLALTCCVTLSMDHLLFDSSLLVDHGCTILIEAQVPLAAAPPFSAA